MEEGALSRYLKMMRVDHWPKNLVMLPGAMLCWIFLGFPEIGSEWLRLATGFFAVCLITSANYVLNEWLDRHFDQYHPVKRHRMAVANHLDWRTVILFYGFLLWGGLLLAWGCSQFFWSGCLLFAFFALLYNVEPFRLKNRVFLDVVSESVNNPIRLTLGWFLLESHSFPPPALLLSSWAAGAFLMAMKRFAEFRRIGNPAMAAKYRSSFASYDENSLLGSAKLYAVAALVFLGIFLIRFRPEGLWVLPAVGGVFIETIAAGFRKDSILQSPEKLYREKRLFAHFCAVAALSMIFFF